MFPIGLPNCATPPWFSLPSTHTWHLPWRLWAVRSLHLSLSISCLSSYVLNSSRAWCLIHLSVPSTTQDLGSLLNVWIYHTPPSSASESGPLISPFFLSLSPFVNGFVNLTFLHSLTVRETSSHEHHILLILGSGLYLWKIYEKKKRMQMWWGRLHFPFCVKKLPPLLYPYILLPGRGLFMVGVAMMVIG